MMIRKKYLPKFVYRFLATKVFVKNGQRAKIVFFERPFPYWISRETY